MAKLATGQIRSRADVIRALVADGHKVVVRSDKNLSVEFKSGSQIRLKGLLYEVGGPEKLIKSGVTMPGQIIETPQAERPTVAQLEKRLAELEEPAAAANAKRYGPRSERAIPTTPNDSTPTPSLRIPVPHLPMYRTAYVWGKELKEDRDVDEIANQLKGHTKELFGCLLGVFKSKDERKIFEYFAQMREQEWESMQRISQLIEEQNRRPTI
jgi:hypothetical protein